MFSDYPWPYMLLCLLAGLLYAGVLYFVGRPRFGRNTRWLLAALRTVAVTVIALLLLSPMTRRMVHERQKPHVVLAVDRSLSVMQSADSTFTLDPIRQRLGERLRLSVAHFGDAAQTDIGSVLENLDDDVDAVVLATDGIYNRGPNPASASERLAKPVYTIALGDTTPQRDAALCNLRTNRVAMMGGSVPVEVTVSATLLHGSTALLTIGDARGRTLYSQRLTYDGDDYALTIGTQLPADAPGLQRYVLTLTVAEGEVNRNNNVLSFYVDVIDTRRKVAIVADAPHPDVAALKRAIESNPNYEAEVFWAENMKWGSEKDDYSLVILHNLPSRQHTDVSFAADMPKMYIIGLQTDLARYNALHTGVEIVAKTRKVNEVTALSREGFSLFNVDAADAAAIEQLPPLSAPFGEARMAEGVQTLFGARLGTIDTRQPLVAAMAQGDRRGVFVWGEGLWRWRLADYAAEGSHDRFDRLVQQLVALAAMQGDRQRLRVETERTYQQGVPIAISAQVYNEAYEPTNQPEVTLQLKGEGSEGEGDYVFHRDGEGYSLTLPDLKEGVYRYHAATADGLTDDGTFAVEAIGLELQRTMADHGLLRAVSQATGGETYMPDEMDALEKMLSELKPTIYTHTKYTDLINLPLVLALIVLLLSAEWLIRKLSGEI